MAPLSKSSLVLAVALALPLFGQSPDSLFAALRERAEAVHATPDRTLYEQARSENLRANALWDSILTPWLRFLDEFGGSASSEQLDYACRTWHELAIRAGLPAADQEAQLHRFLANERLPQETREALSEAIFVLAVAPGKPAPDWTLQDLAADTQLAYGDFRGRLLLLVFAGSLDDLNTRFLTRYLETFHDRYGTHEGFALLTVFRETEDCTRDQLAAFAAEKKLPGRLATDATGMVFENYRALSTPWLCLVDKDGKILCSGPGWNTEKVLERILGMLARRLKKQR